MDKNILRPAIAMIELIFAIVIIGIVLMTAPMLISTASKSGYVAIQQEGISEAASRVNMIMGYHWDKNSADETILDPVMQTSGDADLNETIGADGNGTGRRLGTPKESYRSFIVNNPPSDRLSASSTLGSADAGDVIDDDIDDFTGTINLTFVPSATVDNTADYIEKGANININTSISYIDDNASYQIDPITFNVNFSPATTFPTNIKGITVELTSTSNVDELNKTITLHAFSCNIGAYQLEERSF